MSKLLYKGTVNLGYNQKAINITSNKTLNALRSSLIVSEGLNETFAKWYTYHLHLFGQLWYHFYKCRHSYQPDKQWLCTDWTPEGLSHELMCSRSLLYEETNHLFFHLCKRTLASFGWRTKWRNEPAGQLVRYSNQQINSSDWCWSPVYSMHLKEK